MKIISLVAALTISALAQAGTQIVYSTNGNWTTVVKSTVSFPGKGTVTADKVCVSADGKSLFASIEAKSEKKCVESHIDRSDSTHPVLVCTKSVVVDHPAETWERPLTVVEHVCTKWSVDYSDSTRPVRTCLEESDVNVTQSLSYNAEKYLISDYRHENPTYIKVQTPVCK